MATKMDNLPTEIAHFNNIRNHLPRISEIEPKSLDILLEMGLIQVSTAVEMAIANLGDLDVVSADAYDMSDGTEIKCSTARWHGRGFAHYGANVSNTKNKTGALRVQVYEPMTEKFFYFFIPRSAHSMIKNSSNIEIPFLHSGKPNRGYQPRYLPNWWKYEVSSFDELCMMHADYDIDNRQRTVYK